MPDMTRSVAQLFWFLLTGLNVLLTPLIIFHMRQFYKFSDLDFVHIRRPKLILAIVGFSIICVSMIQPLCEYLVMFISDGQKYKMVATCLPMLLVLILVPRIWFLYYDWRLGIDQMTLQWKQQMYLGKFQLQNPSEALQQHIKNTQETINNPSTQPDEIDKDDVNEISMPIEDDIEVLDEPPPVRHMAHESAPAPKLDHWPQKSLEISELYPDRKSMIRQSSSPHGGHAMQQSIRMFSQVDAVPVIQIAHSESNPMRADKDGNQGLPRMRSRSDPNNAPEPELEKPEKLFSSNLRPEDANKERVQNKSLKKNNASKFVEVEMDRKQYPWTIIYRPYLGRTQYIVASTFIYWLLSSFGIGTVYYYVLRCCPQSQELAYVLYIWIHLLLVIFCISIILIQTKKLHDVMGVYKELKYILINCMIWSAIICGIMILCEFGGYDERLLWLGAPPLLNGINSLIMLRPLDLYAIDDEQMAQFKRIYSVESVTGPKENTNNSTAVSVSCIQFLYFWILSAFHINTKYKKRRKRARSNAGTEKENATNRASITQTSQNKSNGHLSLKDILKLKHGFNALAAHLVRELSLENLLFLVEYMQLKKFVLHNELLEQEGVKWQVEITPEVIEESMNEDLLNSKYYMSIQDSYHVVLSMFHYLYQHYIERSSVASVNVSYQCVNSIKYTMNKVFLFGGVKDEGDDVFSSGVIDMDVIDQLIDSFDTAALQVFRLLYSDSFTRFSKTKEYATLVEQYAED